jgi:hypothetical protein
MRLSPQRPLMRTWRRCEVDSGRVLEADVGIERFLLCLRGKMTFSPNRSSYLCHS